MITTVQVGRVRAAVRGAAVHFGLKLIRATEGLIRRQSLVGNPEFFDPALFPWTAALEAGWPEMRRELEAVLADLDRMPPLQEISPHNRHLSDDDRWKACFFYAFGFKAEENCRRCPGTVARIEKVTGMTTAFFSILAPGKHLPAHRGAYNGLLRVHLPLLLPDDSTRCRIRVGQETRHWQTGKCLVFDDTFDHEVWNDSDQHRAVLFLDVVRPLAFPASLLNRLVLQLIRRSPYVKDGIENYLAWQARLDKAT